MIAAIAACGAKAKPAVAPLPDKPVAEPAKPVEDKPVAAKPPEDKPAPPPAPAPVDLTIAAMKSEVKLVSGGKGKKAPLRLAPKAGGHFPVEIAIDFAVAAPDKQVIPTVVLSGDAEVKTVDKDGRITYALTIKGVDAKDVAGQVLPTDQLKAILGGAVGMAVTGTVSAAGIADAITLHLDAAPPQTSALLEQIVKPSFPTWAALPTEPVAPGAKWTVTTPISMLGEFDLTQVTEFELVARKGNVATIKGTTKVSGKDAVVKDAKISGITGTGTVELELKDGALYPTQKSSTSMELQASPADPTQQGSLKISQSTSTVITAQ
jgi:hypothetical protein